MWKGADLRDARWARTGCTFIELAVLEALDEATGGRPRAHARSAKILAGIEERIGLGPMYAYELVLDLARPWIIPVATVAVQGNKGNRSFPMAAGPGYTECRPSQVGQLMLAAEAGQRAPVPVGLINGTAYRGGTQPPLEPFALLAALRRLLKEPDVPDREVIRIAGPPYSVAGCTVTGDFAALARGRRARLRETGQVTITDVPVPGASADPPAPAGPLKIMGSGGIMTDPKPPFSAHLVIESLPARTIVSEVAQTIASRAASRPWAHPHPELARRAALPVDDIYEDSAYDVRILIKLRPGSDPMAVRDQIAAIEGVSVEMPCAFPATLASLLRSWLDRHRNEDIAASLSELENAIHRDRERERR
jgi:hypothetical protein